MSEQLSILIPRLPLSGGGGGDGVSKAGVQVCALLRDWWELAEECSVEGSRRRCCCGGGGGGCGSGGHWVGCMRWGNVECVGGDRGRRRRGGRGGRRRANFFEMG